MKILAIGDVCGDCGVAFLSRRLPSLRKRLSADLVIVNGENASVRGISPGQADELFACGGDVITLGNHSFANRRICSYLDERRYILRPANISPAQPGIGSCVIDVLGQRVCVINISGRINMDFNLDSPFACVDRIIKDTRADLFAVDFHAEATSEKQAMGYYLDGRVSALWGTHTHVATADEHVLPMGCGYITDIGMTGGMNSVIGVKHWQSVAFFTGQPTTRFESSDSEMAVNGALFDIAKDGRCISVCRVSDKESI